MVRGMSREQARGMVLYVGVGLETWDFDACGEGFLGRDAPEKEATPLLPHPPSSPPPPSRCAAGRQLEPRWVSSSSEARGSLPSGSGHLPATPTLVSGLPLLPP